MVVTYITHPDTRNSSPSASQGHSGLYRDPLPTTDGLLLASHTFETRKDEAQGENNAIVSLYDYRIRLLEKSGEYYSATTELTSGIEREVSFWSPDQLETFSGSLWELQAVEVVSSPIPTRAAKAPNRLFSKKSAPGRRVLAQQMQDDNWYKYSENGAPQSTVKIASDGSIAAFVPAQRALSWQLTDSQGEGVVRERYWLSFQPGEIRTCASCHGVNKVDQVGNLPPQNEPIALKNLLRLWNESYTGVVELTNYRLDEMQRHVFDIGGDAFEEIIVEVSSNLSDWTEYARYRIGAEAEPIQFIVPEESNGKKFYRALKSGDLK